MAMLLILYGSLAHTCWKERSKGGSMLLLSLLLILPPPDKAADFLTATGTDRSIVKHAPGTGLQVSCYRYIMSF